MNSLSVHATADSAAGAGVTGSPEAGIDLVIDSVVSELRRIRSSAAGYRQRNGRSAQLPSRRSLTGIVEGLSAALFPNRLAGREFSADGVDYFVGHTLQKSLGELIGQIQRELYYESERHEEPEAHRDTAARLVREFAASLPRIRLLLEADLQAAFDGDPAAGSVDVVLACYPGITAIIHHRLAHVLHRLGAPLVARIISEISHSLTGIDIHPGASIEGSFFIDHGTGVVIGETAVIGERVRLYQAVTLGARRFPVDENGVLIKGSARHPIVEDDVVIYAGATVLGRITIGRGSVIGGNVWLTRSVPAGSNISQAKLRSEDFDGGSGI